MQFTQDTPYALVTKSYEQMVVHSLANITSKIIRQATHMHKQK